MNGTASPLHRLSVPKSPSRVGSTRRFSSDIPIDPEMLQPSLYSKERQTGDGELTDDEIRSKFKLGEIHFHAIYDVPTQTLRVQIIEAKNLPISKILKRTQSAELNPYIKIQLLPERKMSYQTSVKKRTSNPMYQEGFTFRIPYYKALQKKMRIAVFDFNRESHKVVGETTLPLEGLDLIKGVTLWKPIAPPAEVKFLRRNESILGRIFAALSLTFQFKFAISFFCFVIYTL